MLAQNFKTPTDLGISDAEFDALVKVLGMLERGEIFHIPLMDHVRPNGFNMAVIKNQTECGTTACLCGWAQIISPGTFKEFSNESEVLWSQRSKVLIDLFKFGTEGEKISDITDQQAALALRSFLTHGEPRWDEALAS